MAAPVATPLSNSPPQGGREQRGRSANYLDFEFQAADLTDKASQPLLVKNGER
jgi:hypothetical protein